MTRLLLRNAIVVSVDPNIGNLPKADILIEDGHIAAIGPDLGVSDAEVFDASSYIASPGFVDTHHHVWQSAIRALTADWSLADYFAGIRVVTAAHYRPQDMYAANRHGLLEALHAGVTTTADYCHNLNTPDHAEEALRGTRESGARVIWCYGFNASPMIDSPFRDTSARAHYLLDLATHHFSSRGDRVTLGVCPEEEGLWAGDLDRGRAQFLAARECNARVFWHCNSTRGLAGGDLSRNVGVAADLGVMGPETTLVHMGWSHPDEWARVADSGASFSFTPETELQMGMAWPNIEKANQLGIPFGLGIDIISNNSADLRVTLRMMLQAERGRLWEAAAIDGIAQSGTGVSCAEALRWGTLGGAEALGLADQIGSLTPGKCADVLLHDVRHLTLVGFDRTQLEGTLLLHGTSENLRHVLVDGEFVKRDGEVRNARSASDALAATSEHIWKALDELGGPAGALAAGHEVLAAIRG